MTITNIFPTQFYSSKVSNQDEIQNELLFGFSNAKLQKTGYNFGGANRLTNMNEDVLTKYNLIKTSKMIDENLKQFCSKLNFRFRPYNISAWFTQNIPGAYLQIHHHHTSDITGTYYLKARGDGLDGKFFFESPVPAATHSLCFTQDHWRHYETPEIGKLILFPGWINHGVLTNESDSDRIGISFNIQFKR